MTITIYIHKTADHMPEPLELDEGDFRAVVQTLANGILRGDFRSMSIHRGESRSEWAVKEARN